MRIIALKALAFLLLFKLVDVSLFLTLRSLSRRAALDDGSLGQLYSGRMREQMVAFGDSRIRYQLHPIVLEQTTGLSTYNFGLAASNFDQQIFTLEEYLDKNQTPRAVIFEADGYSLDPAVFKFQTLPFRPYTSDSSRVSALFSNSLVEGYTNKFVQCLAFRSQVFPILASLFSLSPEQVTRDVVKGTPLILRGQRSANFGEDTKSFHIAEARKEGFRRLAGLADTRGFILFLLTTPEYRHDERLKAKEADAAYQFFETLAAGHRSAFYLNYARDERFIHETDLWFDGEHLNIDGMNAFSRVLGHDIAGCLRNGSPKILTRRGQERGPRALAKW